MGQRWLTTTRPRPALCLTRLIARTSGRPPRRSSVCSSPTVMAAPSMMPPTRSAPRELRLVSPSTTQRLLPSSHGTSTCSPSSLMHPPTSPPVTLVPPLPSSPVLSPSQGHTQSVSTTCKTCVILYLVFSVAFSHWP